ncbi:hypothetical protein Psch_01181 [Pelotomaculum schinkii]|uniref:Uncharacterized protein n=1 Tax=Pelotomaculum schinkii TaxID=78350 RepID=A0A4Y7RFP9_9FIRM|nr:hypothetical protein [Pelotomaculum schinkii]TEB07626.1 hypothetical protein Psch_01181 [Pelotomaculum schinkii]
MSDLAALLRNKKQLQEDQEAQTSDINEQCPVEIKSFYDRLEDWLSDLIEEKIILTSYERKRLGSYYSKRFKLKAGEDEIEFIPKKRVVVGSTGKIEMKTKKGNIFFIRDRDGIWKQVVSKSPLNVETLTKPYFRGLLKSLLS